MEHQSTPNAERGRRGFVPRAVVLHTTDGSFTGAREWLTDPESGVSAHYLVSLSGEVVQFVDEADTARHAGMQPVPGIVVLGDDPPNLCTIGIEFADEGRPHDVDRPNAQYEAGALLLAGIARRWGIPLDEAHVRRLAVTSSSAVERHEPTEGWLFERVLQPMVVNGIGRTTYDDMRRAEEIVAGSGLDWTIVRPSGLFPAERPSAYRVDREHGRGRFTARPDLARFLLRQAREPEWIGTRPEVHTDEGTPTVLQVIWNEGVRHAPDPILRRDAVPTAPR